MYHSIGLIPVGDSFVEELTLNIWQEYNFHENFK